MKRTNWSYIFIRQSLGYIPTPKPDNITTRLDMRRLTNKIINFTRAKMFPSRRQSDTSDSFQLPPKLRRTYYGRVEPIWDKQVQDTIQKMTTTLDEQLRQKSTPVQTCPKLNKKASSGFKVRARLTRSL